METLYNWLLHNTGNERNFLTILNVKRLTDEQPTPRLYVMARTGDFETVNLLILPADGTNPAAEELISGTPREQHHLADEDQVIAYLVEGKTADSSANTSGFYVLVSKPSDDAGGLSFPPAEAD